MELGMPPPSNVSSIGKIRKRAPEESQPEDQQLQKMMIDVEKLCLSSAQTLRAIKPILMQTFRISAEGPFSLAMQEAAKTFVTGAKQVQMNCSSSSDPQVETYAAMGLPHHHIFNSCVHAAQAQLDTLEVKQMEVVKAHQAAVKEAVTEINSLTSKKAKWDMVESWVKHMRLVKAFDKRHKKLEISLVQGSPAQNVWDAIHYVLSQTDPMFKALMGQAPKSSLERSVQAYLDIAGEKTKEDGQ